MRKTENIGDEVLCSGFLFFPKTINGETRWLEYASWIERLCRMYQPFFETEEGIDWIPKRWVNP